MLNSTVSDFFSSVESRVFFPRRCRCSLAVGLVVVVGEEVDAEDVDEVGWIGDEAGFLWVRGLLRFDGVDDVEAVDDLGEAGVGFGARSLGAGTVVSRIVEGGDVEFGPAWPSGEAEGVLFVGEGRGVLLEAEAEGVGGADEGLEDVAGVAVEGGLPRLCCRPPPREGIVQKDVDRVGHVVDVRRPDPDVAEGLAAEREPEGEVVGRPGTVLKFQEPLRRLLQFGDLGPRLFVGLHHRARLPRRGHLPSQRRDDDLQLVDRQRRILVRLLSYSSLRGRRLRRSPLRRRRSPLRRRLRRLRRRVPQVRLGRGTP
mmetsp:Transcript_16323/g.53159  ORF Transcript_16323/g.53159 Transcript_16323/m.53159 type:complete len:313 (-) Transcript_16323:204-1142(-)